MKPNQKMSKEERAEPEKACPVKQQRARDLCARWQKMQTVMQPWKTQWQEIADLMMPRKAGITSMTSTPSSSKEALLFDTTAGDAALTMAGGLMSWMTPANESWFSYDPVFDLRQSDRVKMWLQDCSFRVQEMLGNSNFYTEQHEDLLNHVTFGTSALYSAFEDGRFYFESLPVGSFAIEENAFGQVDTLFREFELTARQAREMFGAENLPSKIQDCLRDETRQGSRYRFLHAVYPRSRAERPDGPAACAAWGKPFASCYVELSEKTLVRESGYDSFPFAVGRYLKWSALSEKSPYGYGPGFAALPDARQVNFLQMMLDCAAEKMVRPAMIAPEEMEGELILSAGGITYMASSIGQERWPKPISQVGDYSVGQERIKMRQDAVNAKFHAQLFNMFASLDRQMTAREVAERAAEKITLITPAFSRLTSEKNTPILQRLFALAMEEGMLAPPPEEAVRAVSQFMGMVPDPTVVYTSRLALAIKQLRNASFERQFQGDLQLASVRPDVLDNYNFDVITRDRARNNGMPAEWLMDEKAVAEMRAQRAQAQQASQMTSMLEQGSKAVKNVGGMGEVEKLMEQLG